ncbi:tRNA '-O-ribosylphosphate transferase [Nannizzia gypsea CBS 118893]|uniref:tRNA '-O-ribosylphosphate transferase n=1 Tax=Arthroderma gypseum (strain ATCC MYA-4604 / CBS 118893) TaxID=535722 RepID=E4UTV7_ARTGP|nr:tRNA '-O-ribosylphosphate transferase [Nannizzia gypsea CBS 118893]EFR00763.1 tRNA '-O-ribosylphosphate transferase [Nannizzia gypsea CBS 118893]
MSEPISLADIQFPAASQNISHLLSDLRRSALSITNRLKSMETDSIFVQETSDYYGLPLVANERCGSWYIPPDKKVGSSYFKSTDGHMGQWDFSLRRLNMQVLDILKKHGGCVIVDSTRRGKTMPDALGKTIPIWCAVMNRTLYPDKPTFHAVQFAPSYLGESEESQIESKVNGFVESFKTLNLDIEKIKDRLGKPIRLVWASRDYFSDNDEHDDSHLLVLCSASRCVRGAEMSEGGYIQGAGDDSEGWSHGLTPPVFWKYKDQLMAAGESELPELIQELIEKERKLPSTDGRYLINPTKNMYIGKRSGVGDEVSSFDLVIDCAGSVDPSESKPQSVKRLNLGCPAGKLGSRQLRKVLGNVESFVSRHLTADPTLSLLIVCTDGKDISVGTALMVLCALFDDQGNYCGPSDKSTINKQFIRQRLAWIVMSKEDVNPSRPTLQSINSYLMDKNG